MKYNIGDVIADYNDDNCILYYLDAIGTYRVYFIILDASDNNPFFEHCIGETGTGELDLWKNNGKDHKIGTLNIASNSRCKCDIITIMNVGCKCEGV